MAGLEKEIVLMAGIIKGAILPLFFDKSCK